MRNLIILLGILFISTTLQAKTVYNKETRNDLGVYYRTDNWGIEVNENFNQDNFTEVVPPEECLNGIPCDWNGSTWVIDTSEKEDIENNESDFEMQFDKLLKSFALVILDEINILRVEIGLSERNVKQLKTAIKNKYEAK